MPNTAHPTAPLKSFETDKQLLLESGYFDAQWYTERYPDVARLGLNAADHFLKYGWRLKRHPSAKFNTQAYLERYPDIAKANVNPVLHFIRTGKNEGRTAVPVESDGAVALPLVLPPAAANLETSEGRPTVEAQLAHTQRLLEHYFIQSETLRHALQSQAAAHNTAQAA